MIPENFEQYSADKAVVGEGAVWLKDGVNCTVTLWNNVPLVGDAAGARRTEDRRDRSGSARRYRHRRPEIRKLETGAVVRVPLFLNEGEIIRVDTRTGAYNLAREELTNPQGLKRLPRRSRC